MIASHRHFAISEVAKERGRILDFYREFGEKATKKAFGIDRKTLWVWKKRLKEQRNQVCALVPCSTRPKNTRRMQTDPRIVSFIRCLRAKHPRLGKEKIKPLLDVYCKGVGIVSLQSSTIGKV